MLIASINVEVNRSTPIPAPEKVEITVGDVGSEIIVTMCAIAREVDAADSSPASIAIFAARRRI
jgi:hypothetical protein